MSKESPLEYHSRWTSVPTMAAAVVFILAMVTVAQPDTLTVMSYLIATTVVGGVSALILLGSFYYYGSVNVSVPTLTLRGMCLVNVFFGLLVAAPLGFSGIGNIPNPNPPGACPGGQHACSAMDRYMRWWLLRFSGVMWGVVAAGSAFAPVFVRHAVEAMTRWRFMGADYAASMIGAFTLFGFGLDAAVNGVGELNATELGWLAFALGCLTVGFYLLHMWGWGAGETRGHEFPVPVALLLHCFVIFGFSRMVDSGLHGSDTRAVPPASCPGDQTMCVQMDIYVRYYLMLLLAILTPLVAIVNARALTEEILARRSALEVPAAGVETMGNTLRQAVAAPARFMAAMAGGAQPLRTSQNRPTVY